jgi:hypothetical protein
VLKNKPNQKIIKHKMIMSGITIIGEKNINQAHEGGREEQNYAKTHSHKNAQSISE